MKGKMKKILLTLLCAVLTGASVWGFPVSAAEETAVVETIAEGAYGTNLRWKVTSDGVLTMYGTGAMVSKEESGVSWYAYDDVITKIVVEDGVTTISDWIFYGLDNVTSVSIPNTVESIGEFSFGRCTSLTSIAFPESVKIMGEFCFDYCENLESFSCAGLTIIPMAAFRGCESLREVSLNEGLKEIKLSAFTLCYNLEPVTIPASVELVNGYAFEENITLICENPAMDKFGVNGLKDMQMVSLTVNEYYDYAYEVLELVNKERKANGLSSLKMEKSLLDSAMLRASELILYYSHGRPDGTQCQSVNELMRGENIAMGQCEPEMVMENWMSSAGHRANILDKDATTIGIGCVEQNGYYYWTQCLGSGSARDFAQPQNTTATRMIATEYNRFTDPTTNESIIHKYAVAMNVPELTQLGQTAKVRVCGVNSIFLGRFAVLDNIGVTWSSSNTDVATINSLGTVRAVGPGTTTITATMEHYTVTTEITVNCKGSILKERIYGADRYQTCFAIADKMKEEKGIDKFDTVIIASGNSFADALSGSYLAIEKDAPILITDGKNYTDLHTYIKNNLNKGGTIYVLGGTGAVPANVTNGLDNYVVKRLYGATRYETNLAILNEAGVAAQDILVCSGTGFADCLSASATGKPILLVGDNLTDEQKALLSSTNGKKYILGGEKAVNQIVEEEIDNATRLSGKTRYETSVLIAETFFENPKTVVVAYAWNFPDGLCGGPLAYTLEAPMILTDSAKYSMAQSYVKNNDVSDGFVLGGASLISDTTFKKIFGLK